MDSSARSFGLFLPLLIILILIKAVFETAYLVGLMTYFVVGKQKSKKKSVWMSIFKSGLLLFQKGDKPFLRSQFGMTFEKQLVNLCN